MENRALDRYKDSSVVTDPDDSGAVPSEGKKARASRAGVCALDLGAVRVGVAVSDELGLMAHPRGVLAARPRPAFLAALKDLVAEEHVGRIVVGLPLDMRGTEGEAARRVRGVAQAIADATGCEIELVDERLTTVEAARALRDSGLDARASRARIDEASAVTILQAWLDARARRRAQRRRRP
jgi:putative Holliday junction resolvase